jgi:uncharacterized membrane protein
VVVKAATQLSMIGTTLHLVVVVFGVMALSTTTAAEAQMIMALCNFQEVSLAPCMAGGGGGNNISCACCSSLNRALDAGHRRVCSLLLANPVLASLVTNLLTLPLLLPLPGCFSTRPLSRPAKVSLVGNVQPLFSFSRSRNSFARTRISTRVLKKELESLPK